MKTGKVLVPVLWAVNLVLRLPATAGVLPGVEFQAGLELEDFHYRESHLMREDGWQAGVYGSFRLVGARPVIFDLDFISYYEPANSSNIYGGRLGIVF